MIKRKTNLIFFLNKNDRPCGRLFFHALPARPNQRIIAHLCRFIF
ncbi:hypothetical protein [Moraxella lacunata]